MSRLSSSIARHTYQQLHELLDQLKSELRTLSSSWEAKLLLRHYEEIALMIDDVPDFRSEPLCLQTLSLVLGDLLFNYSSKMHNTYSSQLKLKILKSISSFPRGSSEEFIGLARFLKAMINDFLDSFPDLPHSISYALINIIEMLTFIHRTPFPLVLQASRAILEENPVLGALNLFTLKAKPYLPSYHHKEFTLVLDLDETLGHLTEKGFKPRPGVYKFIESVSKQFEIVCFTAGSKEHALESLKVVDPKRHIQFVLSREHTTSIGTDIVKDLTCLGRDLSKVIIVDNLPSSFLMQPQNGILIPSWIGDESDVSLSHLLEALEFILDSRPSDVRDLVIKINIKL